MNKPTSRRLHSAAALCLLASPLALAPSARATLIAYEGFNYTAATNVPDNAGAALTGGSGWSGGWFDAASDAGANAFTVSATGLSYGSLTVQGNALNRGNDNIGARRNLSASQPDGTYYVSYLFSVGADPANTYAGLAIDNRAYFGLGKVDTHSEFVVGSGFASATPVSTGIQVVANTTYLLVGKIQFSSTGNDTISLWVNPLYSDEGSVGSASATYLHTAGNFTTFSHVQVYQSTANYNLTVDELRIGTSWADVTAGLPVSSIPEPGACGALAGLGGLAFAALRRRRK